MKNLKYSLAILMAGLFLSFYACDDDDDDNNNDNTEQFTSLCSPYLVCANRNPGGVGFDFEYNDEKGGANYVDSLSVSDFTYDIKVKTIKAEKTDRDLAGMPYFTLANNVEAVNYSAIDPTCVGYTTFQNLTNADLLAFDFETDDASFDLSTLTVGETGKPLQSEVTDEFKKLVIGMTWKTTANNDVADDELIWVIKTPEGRWVKLIVTDFPAASAPTETGYIVVDWDFLN
ncbi:MAG: hypothetical protein JEY96_18235 [Bacteroidales bacterium]|nr:hypothetical protein [Bacteroidales bacterium]